MNYHVWTENTQQSGVCTGGKASLSVFYTMNIVPAKWQESLCMVVTMETSRLGKDDKVCASTLVNSQKEQMISRRWEQFDRKLCWTERIQQTRSGSWTSHFCSQACKKKTILFCYAKRWLYFTELCEILSLHRWWQLLIHFVKTFSQALCRHI